MQGVFPPTETGSQLAERMGPGMVTTAAGGWMTTSAAGIWLTHETGSPADVPRLEDDIPVGRNEP